MWFRAHAHKNYNKLVTKILFSDVGWRNKNWDGGYLYYPFLHSTTVGHYVLHVHSVQWNAGMGNAIHLAHVWRVQIE